MFFKIAALLLFAVPIVISDHETYPCEDGWYSMTYQNQDQHQYIAPGCFKFITDGFTWFEAVGYCEVLGGYLVEDLRHADYLLLNALAQMYVEDDPWVSIFWIGGNDFVEEGKWKWLRSGNLVFFYEHLLFPSNPLSII